MAESHDNSIVIITAPSGSGKTTLVKRLLAVCPQLEFSVSACTRSPRQGEQPGRDYYFLSADEFQQKIAGDEFLEWEMVYAGKYYGTLRSELSRIWTKGRFPLVDIDVQGALNIKKNHPGRSLSVFIQAPSLEELKRRLEQRGTDSAESIQERIEKAGEELTFAGQFDTIIVNDDLESALRELKTTVSQFFNLSQRETV